MAASRSAFPLLLLCLAVTAGCASGTKRLSGQSAACADLNVGIAETARDISTAAVRRGTVDAFEVPFWVPGVDRTKAAITERYSRRIDQERTTQQELIVERSQRCPEAS